MRLNRVLTTRKNQILGAFIEWPHVRPIELKFSEVQEVKISNPHLWRPLVVEFYINKMLIDVKYLRPISGLWGWVAPTIKCNRVVEYSPELYHREKLISAIYLSRCRCQK